MIDQIRAMGSIPVSQVGVAGYFIDIGVPTRNGRTDTCSAWNATARHTIPRSRPEIAIGFANRCSKISVGSCTGFGRRTGSTIPERRQSVYGLLSLQRLPNSSRASRNSSMKGKLRVQQCQSRSKFRLPYYDLEPPGADEQPSAIVVQSLTATDKSIEIGDSVRVRYLTEDKKTVRITISKTLSDPDNGVIHFQSPIAKALLGAEEGDEVDVLVGSYVRPAVVESISKKPELTRSTQNPKPW